MTGVPRRPNAPGVPGTRLPLMHVHELREAVHDEDSVTRPGSEPPRLAPESRVTLRVRALPRGDAAQLAGIIRVWELLTPAKRALLADFARLLGGGK